jgi:hypothetical protein
LRRLLYSILRPIFFFGLPFMSWQPWEQLRHNIQPQQFGAGSHHDFRWYFEGSSIVPVENVDAMCEWLAECEYVRDPDLFHERDYWQHPNTFEQLRKGDCEDRALWAWRKLTELGIPAEFYVGRWRTVPNGVPGFHAWVVCQVQGVEYLFEATAPTRDTILRPLTEVRDDYIPHFAVDARFNSRAFGGYMLYLKEERAKQKFKPNRSVTSSDENQCVKSV